MCAFLLRLARDNSGASAVEFGLIGPTFLAMFLGVLNFGIGMQNYNALRAISGDVARYAVVNYQTSNQLTTTQLVSYARSVATNAPYGLDTNRLNVVITRASTQRVTGATEYTAQLTYNVPTYLGIIDLDEVTLSYERPIFVISS